MGFFTKSELGTPSPDRLPHLSVELITDVLDSWDARYVLDNDGDPVGFWDEHLFCFMRTGADQEVFAMRGRWTRSLGVEELDTVREVLNDWHTAKIWPKAYVRTEDEGLGVYADVAITLGAGVTPAQLDDLMSFGLSTTLQLFEHLDERFPQAASAARAAAEERAAATAD